MEETKTELADGKTKESFIFQIRHCGLRPTDNTMSGGCLSSNNQIHLQANTLKVGTTIAGENKREIGLCKGKSPLFCTIVCGN